MENFPKGKLCHLQDKMKISSPFPLLFLCSLEGTLLDAFVSKVRFVHAV